MLNEPARGFCAVHRGWCVSVMQYEVSWNVDFAHVKYYKVCPPGAEELKGRGLYARKWQVPDSIRLKGEENALYDDFCYYHMRREQGLIQTFMYTDDIVESLAGEPMCDEAVEELVGKDYYVEIFHPGEPRPAAVLLHGEPEHKDSRDGETDEDRDGSELRHDDRLGSLEGADDAERVEQKSGDVQNNLF